MITQPIFISSASVYTHVYMQVRASVQTDGRTDVQTYRKTDGYEKTMNARLHHVGAIYFYITIQELVNQFNLQPFDSIILRNSPDIVSLPKALFHLSL